MRSYLCACIGLLLVTPAFANTHPPVAAMAASAQAFLASLSDDLRARAVFPLVSEERENFHFIPRNRLGVNFKDLSPAQRNLAEELLRAGLSARSLSQVDAIIALELVLREIEGRDHRDPGLYYFSVFGTPSPTGDWGWRFEGHHLSINFSIADGRHIAATPSFFGSNPAELRSGPRKGARIFTDEEDLARDLIQSFNTEQRAIAIFSNTAPRDIFTGANRRVSPLEPAGLPTTGMTRAQGDRLLALLRLFVYRHRDEIAQIDLKKIMDAGWENVHFAWAGSLERGEPHYYRIQGPTFVVEYDNTQNNANHVHSVWRDFEGDFGRDILREHYARDHVN